MVNNPIGPTILDRCNDAYVPPNPPQPFLRWNVDVEPYVGGFEKNKGKGNKLKEGTSEYDAVQRKALNADNLSEKEQQKLLNVLLIMSSMTTFLMMMM